MFRNFLFRVDLPFTIWLCMFVLRWLRIVFLSVIVLKTIIIIFLIPIILIVVIRLLAILSFMAVVIFFAVDIVALILRGMNIAWFLLKALHFVNHLPWLILARILVALSRIVLICSCFLVLIILFWLSLCTFHNDWLLGGLLLVS